MPGGSQGHTVYRNVVRSTQNQEAPFQEAGNISRPLRTLPPGTAFCWPRPWRTQRTDIAKGVWQSPYLFWARQTQGQPGDDRTCWKLFWTWTQANIIKEPINEVQKMLKPTIWKLRGVKWTKNLVNHCGPERADQELGKGGRETLGRTYGRRPWRPRRLRLHAGICLPPPRTSVSITCLPRPAVAFSMGASGGFRDKREALGGPEALLFTPPAAGRALSGCAHERLLVQLPLQAIGVRVRVRV